MRPQPQSKAFKTKAAAEAWRAQLQANFDRHSRMRGDAPDRSTAPARGPHDYEGIADDWIVGRIVMSDASPAERPWMWSLDHEFYQGREQTHGYEPTREEAMAAFAKSWRRE